jgi:hypothetical protein
MESARLTNRGEHLILANARDSSTIWASDPGRLVVEHLILANARDLSFGVDRHPRTP